MGAGLWSIRFTQGEAVRRHVHDIAGLDVTGASVRMQIRRFPTDTNVAAEATVTLDDDGTGFYVELTAEQTAAIGEPGDGGRFVHDVFVDDFKLLEGPVEVKGAVTR